MLNLSIATRTNVSGNVIGCRGACADRRQALKACFDRGIFT